MTQPLTPPPEASSPRSPRRRRWLGAGVAGAAAAAGAGFAWWRLAPGAAQPGVEDALWQRSFTTPDGAPLALADWRGQPLIVNFWATWCPPCVRELPLLSEFAGRKATHGIQVVGLAVDKEPAVQKFLQRQPLAFPVGMAADGSQLTRALGNVNGGLPFTVFLDRNGRLRERKIGELSAQDLANWARS